jgi:radical SAM superfamily enzyme YgiQ (UPF0313 family)
MKGLQDSIKEKDAVLKRSYTYSDRLPDVTLINMNLMLVKIGKEYDRENYIPLGILYIASFLEKKGYNVEFIDYQLFSHAEFFDVDLFIKALGKTAPVVGFSCMSNLFPFTVICAKRLKEINPDCKVILGGVGPSPVAKETIETFPFIDSVVTGEGELNMLKIMEGELEALPPVRIAKDLDEIGLPAFSLIDFNDYDAKPSTISSRGCPYSCTFCTEPHNFGAGVRYRSIDLLVEELELIHKASGETLFLFQDDILPLDRERFKKMMKAFEKLSFPIQWKCFGRVDLMNEEIMKEMVDHGCIQIRYGIESGANSILKKIRKGFSIEEAYEVTKQSAALFESVHASFIWGYPFEDEDEFQQTLEWVAKFQDAGATVLLFEFAPLPGSEIYKQYNEGLKFTRDDYSIFVVTGHESVGEKNYKINSNYNEIYQLIEKYPKIFPGFYKYHNKDLLRKKHRLSQYFVTRRNAPKNEADL